MKGVGLQHLKTIEVFILKIKSLENLKNHVSSLKLQKTKVLAAFGQLVDVIFGTGKFR